MWDLIRRLMDARFDGGRGAQVAGNCLLFSMRTLLQVGTDGANVMKGLQTLVRKKFIRDLLPDVDDTHQLQRCLVHATRHDYVVVQGVFVGLGNQQKIPVGSMITMLQGVIKAFRKSDLFSLCLAKLSDDERKSLKTIITLQVTPSGCGASGVI